MQSYLSLDLEALLIVACVSDATMRPFMSANAAPPPTSEFLPEDLRGSISRRMIADKTGIPRETVRRRVDELVAAGLLIVDSEDKLRSATLLGDPECQRAIDSARRAIRLSQQRLSDVDQNSNL